MKINTLEQKTVRKNGESFSVEKGVHNGYDVAITTYVNRSGERLVQKVYRGAVVHPKTEKPGEKLRGIMGIGSENYLAMGDELANKISEELGEIWGWRKLDSC